MTLFSSLLTIFCIVFLGIICQRRQIFTKPQKEGFEVLLFKIIMPSYLFISTYQHDLSSLLNFKYIASYLINFTLIALIITIFFYKKTSASAIYIRILASGYINASMYTLPVITFLLNNPTAGIVGNILQVTVIQPIFIILLNIEHEKQKSLSKKLISVFSTPLIIMPFIGLLLNYLQVDIHPILISSIKQLGNGASGIALFIFGLIIGSTKITLNCMNKDLLIIILTKIILHPLVAYFIAYIMNLNNYWHNSLIIASSAPPAFIVYLLSKQFSIDEEIIQKAITTSSVLSLISLIVITYII